MTTTFSTKHFWLSALLLAALAPLAACGAQGNEASGTGGVGSSSSSTSTGSSTSGGGEGGSAPGTLANVQAIFDLYCTVCHDASLHGLPAYPALSLVSGDTYGALVGKAADQTCGGTRVVPGSPETSYLMLKLGNAAPCSGAHMPRAFEIGPGGNLTAGEMETVRSWIASGARP